MGLPDEDRRAAQTPGPKYESFAEPKVNVKIDDLLGYYDAMMKLQMDAAGPSAMELTPIANLVREGLNTPGDDGVGVFAEGAVIARSMMQRQSDFRAFLTDAMEGIRNVGSAAAVIAEIYHGGDSESAADVSDIAFAFSDPSARPPEGFDRKFESWSEYEQRMREEAGQTAMALTGSDQYANVIRPTSGITIYYFSDGSSKQVTVTYDSGGNRKVTTEIFGTGRQLLQETTESDVTSSTGNRVQTTSTTRYDGENGTGSRSTTTTETADDGTLTINNEMTRVDPDGNPTGDTTKSDPVTVAPTRTTSTNPEAGPVEEAVEKTGSYGGDEWVETAGRTY